MTPFEPFERSTPMASNLGQKIEMPLARFAIGEVVRHRLFDFRGVVFDVDPEFANSEEWYQSIPEDLRPSKDQPFYHLLAENAESSYVAYVSQQNLLPDDSDEPINHPAIAEMFQRKDGRYRLRPDLKN
jgi:heat shock protein HspQ